MNDTIDKGIESYPLYWPKGHQRTPERERQHARFGKRSQNVRGYKSTKNLTTAQAIDRLFKEISAFTRYGRTYRIDPSCVVLSTNVHTRKDGRPYSNAREPEDTGVAVYFDLDGRPHCLPCDHWTRVADNTAAIAAHLGAMRGMERWGVGDITAHFQGFAMLPAPDAVPNWWEVLRIPARSGIKTAENAFRSLAKEAHADTGGSDVAMRRLNAAVDAARDALK